MTSIPLTKTISIDDYKEESPDKNLIDIINHIHSVKSFDHLLDLANDWKLRDHETDSIKYKGLTTYERLIDLVLLPGNAESRSEYISIIKNQLERNNQQLKSILNTTPGTTINDNIIISTPTPCSKVFLFDIDNCLYSKHLNIHMLMQILIRKYFQYILKLDSYDIAKKLNEKYYKQYGLAIKGLINEHPDLKIDPVEYNSFVDDALPLHEIIKPDLELRETLLKIKQSGKFEKMWLYTNAYKSHALRCIVLLGIADIFDGLTFCDYEMVNDMICKPDPISYWNMTEQVGLRGDTIEERLKECVFIDDSLRNLEMGMHLNMKKCILIDHDVTEPYLIDAREANKKINVIGRFKDLESVLPELF
ncbi:hypothetical protein QEN19_001173 [Hanseniaspora menglaensis]